MNGHLISKAYTRCTVKERENTEETSVMKADIQIPFDQEDVNFDVVDRTSLSSEAESGIGYQSQAGSFNSSAQVDGTRKDPVVSAQQNNFHHDEFDSVQISKIIDIKAKLKANYTLLVAELNPKDVLPQLFEKDVITFDEMEELGPKARRDSAIQLLGILMRKKESDCAKFVESLHQVGYTDIFDSIVNTDQKPQLEILPAPWFDELPDSTKNKILSEIDASRLATILGNNWESVLYNLGFRKAQIDQEFQSNGSNAQRTISNTLIKWKQRSGRNATFNNLIKIFRESEKNNNAHIDWERLETFF
ncbi:death domain-containing protein CRADD-like isoform X1 [Physella acuta]|uniref:death domain-containing protein CRADD-like isoform X1 n=1 Tax=Physella acuta TaxID=109671 RepID=UPI0027DC0025|nr:death domain-containing protein CRADD-like isoform X1 [Physella acuta]